MQSALNEVSVIGAISSYLDASKNNRRKDKERGTVSLNGSISRYSKNLIMSFPLLCDSTIPLDTAMMISKANERNISNMLQLLFASINLNFMKSSNVTGADIINSFYKDIDPNMDLNDFIDLMDKLSGGNGDGSYYAKLANESTIKDLMEQFKTQKSFRMDSINEKSLNDYTVNHIHGKTVVKESHYPINTVGTEPEDAPDNVPYGRNSEYYKTQDTASNIRKEKEQKRQNDIKNKRDKENDAIKNQRDAQKDLIDLNKSRLVASDIKKVNDLEPTLMVINYNTLSDDGKTVIDRKSFLAGLKSRFIPVESVDVVERFVSKDRTKISLKNLIRATTGEIGFWKDFVLCLNKLKLDAKNAAKKGYMAKFWNVLEKRSNKNNLRKLQRSGNDGSAITTIAISQDTVNYMKKIGRAHV